MNETSQDLVKIINTIDSAQQSAQNIINTAHDNTQKSLTKQSKFSKLTSHSKQNIQENIINELQEFYSPVNKIFPLRDKEINHYKKYLVPTKQVAYSRKYRDTLNFITESGRLQITKYNNSRATNLLLFTSLVGLIAFLNITPLIINILLITISTISILTYIGTYMKKYYLYEQIENYIYKNFRVNYDKYGNIAFSKKQSDIISFNAIAEELRYNNDLLSWAKVTHDITKTIIQTKAWNSKEVHMVKDLINPQDEFNIILQHLANIQEFTIEINNTDGNYQFDFKNTINDMMDAVTKRVVELELFKQEMIEMSAELVELEKLESSLELMDTMDKYQEQIMMDEFAQLDIEAARAQVEGIREILQMRIKNLTA